MGKGYAVVSTCSVALDGHVIHHVVRAMHIDAVKGRQRRIAHAWEDEKQHKECPADVLVPHSGGGGSALLPSRPNERHQKKGGGDNWRDEHGGEETVPV